MSKKLGAVGSATMAQKALKEVGDASHGVGRVILCGRSSPVEQVRGALLGAKWSSTSAVESYAIRRLRPEDRDQLRLASVVVYGGEVAHTLADETRADLEVVGRVGRPPALRPYVLERVIDTAARRNAVIAAAIWIPGADMPLLTAVEMRMVLLIGVCYGVEVGADRAVELLTLLGAGFGLRAAARELLDVVPIAGWVVKGGVAYAGTRALGRAAVEYFERGAVADVSSLRTLAEHLRS
jgi:uncharacterized protein (DUF697 family)